MVVFVNSIGACFVVNYLAESTLAVLSPKFRDRSASLRFDDERSHIQSLGFVGVNPEGSGSPG